MASETEISKAIAAQLDTLGVFHLRLNSGRVRVRGGWMMLCPVGTPDRFALLNGRAVFFEVKKPGEKPTPEQLACHETIRQHGGAVIVVESAAQVWAAFQELTKCR